jgi:hypothetical protein
LGDRITELFRGFLVASSPAIMVQITQHFRDLLGRCWPAIDHQITEHFRHRFDVYRRGAQ